MQRNLNRRVEAVIPVEDEGLQARLEEILQVNLADDVLAWRLQGDGSWARVADEQGVETHRRLHELALERSRRPDVLGAS